MEGTKRTENLTLSLAIAVAVLVLCVVLFWPILKSVIFAATVAVVLSPYYHWLERKLWGEKARPWKKALTAGLLTVAAVVVVAVLLVVAVVLVVDNFALLKEFVVKVASVIQGWLGDVFGAEINLAKIVADSAQQLFGYVQSIFLAALDLLVKIVIFVLSLYFFLRHGGHQCGGTAPAIFQNARSQWVDPQAFRPRRPNSANYPLLE